MVPKMAGMKLIPLLKKGFGNNSKVDGGSSGPPNDPNVRKTGFDDFDNGFSPLPAVDGRSKRFRYGEDATGLTEQWDSKVSFAHISTDKWVSNPNQLPGNSLSLSMTEGAQAFRCETPSVSISLADIRFEDFPLAPRPDVHAFALRNVSELGSSDFSSKNSELLITSQSTQSSRIGGSNQGSNFASISFANKGELDPCIIEFATQTAKVSAICITYGILSGFTYHHLMVLCDGLDHYRKVKKASHPTYSYFLSGSLVMCVGVYSPLLLRTCVLLAFISRYTTGYQWLHAFNKTTSNPMPVLKKLGKRINPVKLISQKNRETVGQFVVFTSDAFTVPEAYDS